MAPLLVQCGCCFSDVDNQSIVLCDSAQSHVFCFECVCRYMISGIADGQANLVCIHKRACNGSLKRKDVLRFMERARECLSKDMSQRLEPPPKEETTMGTAVDCSRCNRPIRKLAFYNYVSCICGRVVCYGCGQDITYTIQGHSCSPTSTEKEPQWFGTSCPDNETRASITRRQQLRSICARFSPEHQFQINNASAAVQDSIILLSQTSQLH